MKRVIKVNYADEIKRRVTARELFQFYGFEINRGGFCKSPFSSNDKTPSLKVYDGGRGWHDFSSGNGGSVIDFVMQYFGLSFKDSLAKINEDFSLGLPIGEKLDRRKHLEMNRQAFMRKRAVDAERAEQERIYNAYWTAFDEWKRLDENKRKYAPETPVEPLHPLFVEALKNISGAEYRLECAEIERYEHERRNSRDS